MGVGDRHEHRVPEVGVGDHHPDRRVGRRPLPVRPVGGVGQLDGEVVAAQIGALRRSLRARQGRARAIDAPLVADAALERLPALPRDAAAGLLGVQAHHLAFLAASRVGRAAAVEAELALGAGLDRPATVSPAPLVERLPLVDAALLRRDALLAAAVPPRAPVRRQDAVVGIHLGAPRSARAHVSGGQGAPAARPAASAVDPDVHRTLAVAAPFGGAAEGHQQSEKRNRAHETSCCLAGRRSLSGSR